MSGGAPGFLLLRIVMYEPHELALLIPAMKGEEYERLKTDIAENSLLEPIVLLDGKILDGIHRERACGATGVTPRYEEFTGTDPARYVVSKNVNRRMLTAGQRAMVAERLVPHFAKAAKKRMLAGVKDPTAHVREGRTAAKDAADAAGTSERLVQQAQRVRRKRPDLAKKVETGEMTMRAADLAAAGKTTEPEPKKNGRPKNWDGKSNAKRQREIREKMKTRAGGDYNALVKIQLRISELCAALQTVDLAGYEVDEPNLTLVVDMHDDLMYLAQWHDRALMIAQSWLQDADVLRKIDALENRTVANGASEEEADTATRLAERLRRKLNNRLAA